MGCPCSPGLNCFNIFLTNLHSLTDVIQETKIEKWVQYNSTNWLSAIRMEIEPRHTFLMAAKYEWLSESIKTGSFVYFQFSNNKRELEVDDEKDRFSISVSRIQKISAVYKSFVCDMCDKEFKQKSSLKSHQRIHTGDKHHVCGTCHKGFAQKATLEQHQRVHTGDKPCQCKTCHKRFAYMTNLNSHHLVHTSEKPYMCDICGKAFTQKSSLGRHQRGHTW